MAKRYVSIWFRHLQTDWVVRRRPELKNAPFVLSASERGRVVIKAANGAAQAHGIDVGMVVADCRAVLPQLQVLDEIPGLPEKILAGIGEWCLRFTPVVAVDLPYGLLLDITGCAHLWGGEKPYLKDILTRLRGFGYDVRAAIADTIGAAWAVARYGQKTPLIESGKQADAITVLPTAALRLEADTIERLEKLGLLQIGSFMSMPRSALRRRFGAPLLQQLDKALGQEMEMLQPIRPIQPYQERLPALEPIRTAKGIEIALQQLLETLCARLSKEEKGLRKAVFKGYRIDGNVQQIQIGTNRPSRDTVHLFKLFEVRIAAMEPDLGFELFILEAPTVEDYSAELEQLWQIGKAEHEKDVAELLDRIAGKIGVSAIHRYLPAEHYWPERSIKLASSLEERPQTIWRADKPRPVHLLPQPEEIEVSVPLPDYPPMLFKYQSKLYRISKADGPERIEQEWWLQDGEHRDYYCVEDEEGGRYWLFRLGSYQNNNPQWFIHGFFA